MNIEDMPILGSSIDKSEVSPIHQKRILAFVNQFIISTVSFLNDFTVKCEEKFIELERKIQRIETSLIIIESKISSIQNPNSNDSEDIKQESQKQSITIKPDAREQPTEEKNDNSPKIIACEDIRYQKYFKMLQFGVPPNAVKMKMDIENLDSNILGTPNKVVDIGIATEE